MPVVDELVTILGLKMSGTGLATASRFRSTLQGVAKASLVVSAALAAFGVAVGVTAIKTAESVDQQSKFARSLGVSFEQLQELQFAAERAGGTASGLNASLENLTKTMSSPIPGQYNETLLLLGINVRKSNGQLRVASDVLLDISKRFQSLTTIQQQQFGSKLGFDEGTIRLLQQGAPAIKKLEERAKSLGNVLSTKSGRQAEAFEDTLLDFKTTILGISRSLSIALIPNMTTTLKQFQKFLDANKSIIRQNLKTIILGVGEGFKIFGDGVKEVVTVINDLLRALGLANTKLTSTKLIAFATAGVLGAMGLSITGKLLRPLLKLAVVLATVGARLFGLKKGSSAAIKGTEAIAKKVAKTGLLKRAGRIGLKGIKGAAEFLTPEATLGLSLLLKATTTGKNDTVPVGGFKPSKELQQALSSKSPFGGSSSHQTVNITVNGARDPQSVAKEVVKQGNLNSVKQLQSPGFNRLRVS